LLLGALVCAGQIYGMEPQEPMGAFAQLPKELHQEIIRKAIESSDTLEEFVKAVNVACALQGVCYDNLKDFTKLMHMLADKFDTTTHEVAGNFHTSLAEKYIQLGEQLLIIDDESSQLDTFDKVTQLINDGADVNFTMRNNMAIDSTPLFVAIQLINVDVVKLLMQSGVIPTSQNLKLAEAVMDITEGSILCNKKAAEIVQIIKNAMKKYPPSH